MSLYDIMREKELYVLPPLVCKLWKQCSLYKLRYTPIHRGNLSQSQCNLSDWLIEVIANTWYLSHLPTHSHPHPTYTHVSAHRSHQSWAALVYQRGWTRPVPHTCRRWTKNSCSRKFFLWASREEGTREWELTPPQTHEAFDHAMTLIYDNLTDTCKCIQGCDIWEIIVMW